MKNIYNRFAELSSYFFSIRLFDLGYRMFKKIYWFAYRKGFKKIGVDSFIEYPFKINGSEYISIGDNTIIAGRIRMEAIDFELNKKFSPELRIGNKVTINYDCHIACVNKIIIEDSVLIAGKVFISDHSHGDTSYNMLQVPPAEREIISLGPVTIGKNVWIGESVCILPNVSIGHNSVIGANSVVTKSIPPFSVAAGVPAKVIKSYSQYKNQ